jgi:hypothetical protein
MPPTLRGQLWWLRIFFYTPEYCLDTFNCRGFFLCLSHLPPIWGVILVKVISKKCYQAQKGTAKDIFQPCERIIKDGLSSSQMHAFRIDKPCFHTNMQNDFSLFIQIKLSFRVTSWCFCFFQVFSEYGYLSKESLEFPELVCLNKHQYDFCFVLNFEFPKILVNMYDRCIILEGKRETHQWFRG